MHAAISGTTERVSATNAAPRGVYRDAHQAGAAMGGGMDDFAGGVRIVRGRAKAREEKIYLLAVGAIIAICAFAAAFLFASLTGCATLPTHGAGAPAPDTAAWRCYVAAGARCASEAAAAPPCHQTDAGCIAMRALAAGLCLEAGYRECVDTRESEK